MFHFFLHHPVECLLNICVADSVVTYYNGFINDTLMKCGYWPKFQWANKHVFSYFIITAIMIIIMIIFFIFIFFYPGSEDSGVTNKKVT